MFDLNGDGFVEKEDLIKIYKVEEEDLKNFIDTLFKEADADGDGKLNFQGDVLLAHAWERPRLTMVISSCRIRSVR